MREQHLYSQRRLYAGFFAPHATALLALTLAGILLARAPSPGRLWLLWWLADAAFVITLWRSAAFFRRTFLDSARQIEQIRARYSLILPDDPSRDYAELLHFILSTVDHALDQEYSSQLLRKQAEFDRMKSQINPHFLYNTLDSIRGYALAENSPVTADIIEVLSRIFRYTISQKNEQIALEQELGMLKDYISIQEYRLNGHIPLQIKVQDNDTRLYQLPIPKLILQPFIENAITHGMKDIRSNFAIAVQVSTTQSRLIISISDNGCGMPADRLAALNERLYADDYGKDGAGCSSHKGSGIAITNVNARIRLLYGSEYGVIAYSTPGVGSEFQISLPYKEGAPS